MISKQNLKAVCKTQQLPQQSPQQLLQLLQAVAVAVAVVAVVSREQFKSGLRLVQAYS